MALFKKGISPQDLGKVLYVNIRYAIMSSESPLYHKKLISDINEEPDNLKWSIEIIILAMFLTHKALIRKYPSSTCIEIMNSIHSEFMTHIQSILSDVNMVANQIVQLIADRFNEYHESSTIQKGAGPSWHFGKKAYWNIIGQEKTEPLPPMQLSLYAIQFKVLIDDILKNYKIKNE